MICNPGFCRPTSNMVGTACFLVIRAVILINCHHRNSHVVRVDRCFVRFEVVAWSDAWYRIGMLLRLPSRKSTSKERKRARLEEDWSTTRGDWRLLCLGASGHHQASAPCLLSQGLFVDQPSGGDPTHKHHISILLFHPAKRSPFFCGLILPKVFVEWLMLDSSKWQDFEKVSQFLQCMVSQNSLIKRNCLWKKVNDSLKQKVPLEESKLQAHCEKGHSSLSLRQNGASRHQNYSWHQNYKCSPSEHGLSSALLLQDTCKSLIHMQVTPGPRS